MEKNIVDSIVCDVVNAYRRLAEFALNRLYMKAGSVLPGDMVSAVRDDMLRQFSYLPYKLDVEFFKSIGPDHMKLLGISKPLPDLNFIMFPPAMVLLLPDMFILETPAGDKHTVHSLLHNACIDVIGEVRFQSCNFGLCLETE